MSKKSIEIKVSMDTQALVALLENIVANIKSGVVCIQRDEACVAIKPTEQAEVSIEAGVKKDRQKLKIAMSWREVAPAMEAQCFTISNVEPEPPVAPEPPAAADAHADAPTGTPADAPVDADAPTDDDDKAAKPQKKGKK